MIITFLVDSMFSAPAQTISSFLAPYISGIGKSSYSWRSKQNKTAHWLSLSKKYSHKWWIILLELHICSSTGKIAQIHNFIQLRRRIYFRLVDHHARVQKIITQTKIYYKKINFNLTRHKLVKFILPKLPRNIRKSIKLMDLALFLLRQSHKNFESAFSSKKKLQKWLYLSNASLHWLRAFLNNHHRSMMSSTFIV